MCFIDQIFRKLFFFIVYLYDDDDDVHDIWVWCCLFECSYEMCYFESLLSEIHPSLTSIVSTFIRCLETF